MPTYEYRCRDCGEPLEVVQSFTDDPLETCPSCGGSLRKVFGAVGISFKGSGFYKTDSRSTGTKTSTSSGAGSSESGSGGTEAAKPAASSESTSSSGGDSGSTSTSTPAAKTPA